MKFVSRGRQLGALRSSGDKKETTTTTTTAARAQQKVEQVVEFGTAVIPAVAVAMMMTVVAAAAETTAAEMGAGAEMTVVLKAVALTLDYSLGPHFYPFTIWKRGTRRGA